MLSVWLIAIIASLGGLSVFVGLCLEKIGDPEEFRDASHLKKCRSKRKNGERLVRWGVFAEMVLGFFIAAWDGWQSYKNDPWNGKISEVSADLYFQTTLTNDQSFTNWRSSRPAALLMLGTERPSYTNGVTYFPPMQTTMPGLAAFDFMRMETTSAEISSEHISYSLNFRSIGVSGYFDKIPVTDLSKVDFLWIQAVFLPTNCEVEEGIAKVVVNGKLTKTFSIPKQIPFGPMKTLVATNFANKWE